MHRAAAVFFVLALAACGSNEPGLGGVTANEAAALDDAAAMVESQRLPEGAARAADAGAPAGTESAQPAN